MGKKKNRKPQAYRENGNLSVEVDPVEKSRLDRARKISRETTKGARDQASKKRAYMEPQKYDITGRRDCRIPEESLVCF